MRNMMFARTFPHYHPRKGQPTWFVQKMWKCLYDTTQFYGMPEREAIFEQHFPVSDSPEENIHNQMPKGHTIRAGNRWKVGDFFSPRVWSGRPYNSKTIEFAPPIMVEKEWKIKFDECGVVSINGFYDYSEIVSADNFMEVLARNDGLSEEDFYDWFPTGKIFEGQIICWNKNICYE